MHAQLTLSAIAAIDCSQACLRLLQAGKCLHGLVTCAQMILQNLKAMRCVNYAEGCIIDQDTLLVWTCITCIVLLHPWTVSCSH